jgi:DNA-binding beta-propeller fold protein YncE
MVNPWGIAVEPDGSQICTANFNSGNIGIISQVQPETLTVH